MANGFCGLQSMANAVKWVWVLGQTLAWPMPERRLTKLGENCEVAAILSENGKSGAWMPSEICICFEILLGMRLMLEKRN